MLNLRWMAAVAAGTLAIGLGVCGGAELTKPANARCDGKAIAVVDVNSIFKTNARFKNTLADLQSDAKFAQAKLQMEVQELSRDSDRLKQLPPDSEEYRKLERDILRRRSTLDYDLASLRKTWIQREAKVYYELYQEVMRTVADYAKGHNLSVVLNADRQPVDVNKLEDVQRALNNKVIWAPADMDITPAIMKMLEPKKPVEKPRAQSTEKPQIPVKPTPAQQTPEGQKPQEKQPQEKKPTGGSSGGIPELAKVVSVTSTRLAADKPAEKTAAKPSEKPQAKLEKPVAKLPAKPEKPAEKPKKTVVRFTIRGDYPEGPSQPGLFGELQPSLAKVIQRLEDAAADKAVAAIWLQIEDVSMGRGKIHELRSAIARVRKTGKPVYAELASADTGQYLLAAACDEVFMPPSGMLLLPGVRAEMTFYKGLLDKLGLQFDALQMGKYKGAVEPMTRTSMSGPLRESMEAIVDDVFDTMVDSIAKDRRIKDYLVKLLIDQGMFSAVKAQQAGLIDRVLYADQFEESLRKKLGVEKLDLNTTYKKKQIESDFSGLGGMMKLMELFSGGKPTEKAGAKQRIAVVYAVGEIVEGKSSSGFFGGESLGSTTMIEAIRKAADDPKVVAVVMRVDSPGGSATASDLIWRETLRLKKPFIVSMGDVAGSGGYYIAMGAKKIYAEPGTITGSIGVIGGKLVTKGLYEKIGVNTEVISRGRNSGSFSSTQPFTAEERKAWTDILSETYDQFITKAAEGRKMDKKRVAELAQGRVYTGRAAKKLGLIDEIGTLQDAVIESKKAAGLKPDADVDLLILPKPRSMFEQLFGDSSISTELESAMPEALQLLRQTQLWRRLLSERVLLWMPYGVKLK